MRTLKITCPYCNNQQKIFHLSYNLKKFFNIFQKAESLIPTKAITDIHKIIKKFSCKACLKDLILNKRNGIAILKNKISKLENVETSPENEKLLEYLRIKAIKEDEELNHLVEENKHLPINL